MKQRVHAGVTGAIVMLILSLALLLSCDEGLPPRADPLQVFNAWVQFNQNLTPSADNIRCRLIIQNRYDETLSGVAALSGRLTITSVDKPAIRKTFDLSTADLASIHQYNSVTHELVLNPRDTITFLVFWDYYDDNGIDIRPELLGGRPDPSCGNPWYRKISDPKWFTVSAQLNVFPRTTPALVSDSSVHICYVSKYVLPRDCPPYQDMPDPCVVLGYERNPQ